MPSIPENIQKQWLHNYIKKLVVKFGRETYFTISDLYTCGGTERILVGAHAYLPPQNVSHLLEELEQKKWITLRENGDELEFKVTTSYTDLPDMITAEDIYKEKLNMISNILEIKYPNSYQKLVKAQKSLLVAQSVDDFSHVGLLCVEFWEDFSSELWQEYFPTDKLPPRDKVKNKVSPIVEKFVKAKLRRGIYVKLGELFEELIAYNQNIKHRRVKSERDAKLALITTVLIAEEILAYLNDKEDE